MNYTAITNEPAPIGHHCKVYFDWKDLDSPKKDPFGSKTVGISRSNDHISTWSAFEKLMEDKIFMTKNSNEI